LIASTATCDNSVHRGEKNFMCRPKTFWPIEVRTRPEPKSSARLTSYNSALQLPCWRWPVMWLSRLNVYDAIMAILFDATELESFWCSTIQTFQKLSTKVLCTLIALCNNIFVRI